MTKHTDCQSLLASLSDYVDGTVKDEFCRKIERHLAKCPDCRVVVDTLKKTIYLYHATSEIIVPSGVRERLFRCLNLDDFLKKPIE